MNRLKKNIIVLSLIIASSICTNVSSQQQDIDSPLLIFNRGKLWQSMYLGKSGPSAFSNWRKTGVGLDWPGFDPTLIRENLGGSASYMLTGGFWIGCKKDADSVLAVEDWSIYASTIAVEQTSKYIVTKHKKIENHGLQNNPNIGEEVIETSWEYNPSYQNEFDIDKQLPLRVTRTSHQWNGSLREENYIIHDYIIENISDEIKLNYPTREVADTLYDFYMLLNYALHCNSRSWSVLFPTATEGARNTWFFYNPSKKMISGQADDYGLTTANDGVFGFAPSQGPIIDGTPTGEWLSPGFVGLRVLYASPNDDGRETHINKFGWSGADNLQDLIGPMTGKGTPEARYEVVADPSLAPNYVTSPLDTVFMRRSRMWSMMNMGPWTLAPGDSIRIVYAEMVDGADYKNAIDPDAFQAISSQGLQIFNATADKAKFTFDNNFNHPDPPEAPSFNIDFNREQKDVLGIIVKWRDDTEGIPDPDDGQLDLAGYNVYRSNYLPIGPWNLVTTINKGDLNFYDPQTSEYTFLDSTVTIGAQYYYALTAFDTGRTVWNINPNARFRETGNSTVVPPLESSIFANRMVNTFTATVAPVDNLDEVLVVPNPFVIGEGFSLPGEEDNIQFVNIPNPCTIRIYTVRGDLVRKIEVAEGTGAIAEWDQVTDFGQFVVSGIYIYHVESEFGTKVGKLAIVR